MVHIVVHDVQFVVLARDDTSDLESDKDFGR